MLGLNGRIKTFLSLHQGGLRVGDCVLGPASVCGFTGTLIVARPLSHFHLCLRSGDACTSFFVVKTDQRLVSENLLTGPDQNLTDNSDHRRHHLYLARARLHQTRRDRSPLVIRFRLLNCVRLGASGGDLQSEHGCRRHRAGFSSHVLPAETPLMAG
jgi:hypothetical protein